MGARGILHSETRYDSFGGTFECHRAVGRNLGMFTLRCPARLGLGLLERHLRLLEQPLRLPSRIRRGLVDEVLGRAELAGHACRNSLTRARGARVSALEGTAGTRARY